MGKGKKKKKKKREEKGRRKEGETTWGYKVKTLQEEEELHLINSYYTPDTLLCVSHSLRPLIPIMTQ